jgi:hypothetical protein
MIELDGSHGEGGGAILRQALALSMLKRKLECLRCKRQRQQHNNLKQITPANMPSILTATKEVTNFPNKFISPFGDDPIVPIYSSIPFTTNQNNCLPCAVCGSNFERNNILKAQAEKFANYTQNISSTDDISVGFN